MALTSDNVKPVPKTTASWFEFLFDTTGDALKKHLGDASAEPSATQLIVQFLERSGLGSINVNAGSEDPLLENRRAQRLCHLALRVAAYLQWNLEILEENLSLPWQNVLLDELMKTIPSLQGMLQSDVDISSLDQKSAMTLIIYYRWVIRTLSQHFLPNVVKSNINGVTAENLANENILRKLQEQLPTAIHILNQALQVLEGMSLPTAPSLLPAPKKKDISEQEKASSDVVPADDDPAQSMEVDDADKDNVDNKADAKNGSDESNNGSTAGEKMETCTEEVYKVRKDDIIAQVSFDLGTLYFYQEKFQQAMKLFERCKNAQCSQSSFYTVNEDKLRGYYMACCGLTGTSPTTSVPLKDTKPSLTMRLEQCRHGGYKDVIPVLLEDNVTFELPLEYRESLVAELKTQTRRMDDEDDSADNIALDWQIMVCNIIREVLEGRPANTGFWLSLENCTENHLEFVFTFCLQSLQVEEDFPAPRIKDSNRFKVLKSFVQLICCNCELVNGWEIARNSAAKIFLDEEEEAMDEAENGSSQTQHDSLSCTPVNAQLNTEAAATGQESIELKRGFLCDKLRHTVDPNEISTIVEQLHQLEKGKRQSQEFVCLLYKSHLEEIKNIQQQDILHILFSKALHCSAIQEYNKASQLLSYALGMVNSVAGRGAVSSPLERVKAAIHQELLVLDICNETNNKRPDEISNRIKSYVWQTATGAAESHIEEQVNAFLLNAKEWEFLLEMRVDENAQTLDHRSLSSLLASTCYLLSKPQGWRKPARILWDGVLKIFSNNMGQQKRPADGGQGIAVTRTTEGLRLTNLIHFVRKIKEETVLTVLISCLVRLRNASNKVDESGSQKEISSSHSHLWPTTITNSGNVNFDHIGLALSAAVHHALSVQHHNISWLLTLADIYMDSGNYSSALQCYLEVGAVSSSFFNLPVPSTIWDDQVYRKMVTCCSAMKAHIQAALLCQCMEVKDYTTAFKALQQASSASSDAMDFYYAFFWDITMLEYLTYTHAKRGQNDKKLLTIQAISQPDLNIFNSSELLQHTEQSRKAKLLRTLAKQYL